MTRFDDDLHDACAWGRWRIGQALNEPVISGSGERRGLDDRLRQRGAQKPLRAKAEARGAARLCLVADDGRPVGGTPGSIR